MKQTRGGDGKNKFAKLVFLGLNTGESGRGKTNSQRLESLLQSDDEGAQGWAE